MNRTENREC